MVLENGLEGPGTGGAILEKPPSARPLDQECGIDAGSTLG
jgi:hypothetical protein